MPFWHLEHTLRHVFHGVDPIVLSSDQFFFVNGFVFELLAFLLLSFRKNIVLFDICLAFQYIAALQTWHLLINLVFFSTLHAGLAVHGVVIKSFDGTVSMHDALFWQQLLFRILDVRGEVAVQKIVV